jgi:hypothetical protein
MEVMEEEMAVVVVTEVVEARNCVQYNSLTLTCCVDEGSWNR